MSKARAEPNAMSYTVHCLVQCERKDMIQCPTINKHKPSQPYRTNWWSDAWIRKASSECSSPLHA
eukprot:533633-Pyramimonas_sp.AAC.1